MDSYSNFNSFAKTANSLTRSAVNSVNSTISSAVNSIGQTTLSAVDTLGESTFGAVNSFGNSTASVVNSFGNSTASAVNSFGNSTVSAVNSFGNSTANAVNTAFNAINNIGNSNVFKNVNTTRSVNNSSNYSANYSNSGSTSSGWSTFFGIIIILVSVFLLIMVIFKDQISDSWDYLKVSLQKMFGMNPPNNETKEQIDSVRADDIQSPMPTTLDTAYEARQDETNIIHKILPMGPREVFNVSSNEYSYYDAEPLCRALGAELATYDQVKAAWNNGADWCNYGWTKGQVAIYPTQKETWEKLQGGPDDEHTACGRPGVNGGYFDNPEMKFGVNCYGVKPEQSANDERILMENGTIPKTVATLKIDQQIQDIKNNTDMIGILPYNSNKWSTS